MTDNVEAHFLFPPISMKVGRETLQEIQQKTSESIGNCPTKHKGLRYNSGKPRYDLVHPWSHEQMVNVLTRGAEKYAPRNWERGMEWSNVLASMKRHIAKIEQGEDYDLETGELHAAHVACNAHFLTAYYKIYPQGDNRSKSHLSSLRIGLDIDEVLADWVGGWMVRHNITKRPESWMFDRKIKERFKDMHDNGTGYDFYLGLDPLISPKDIPFEPVAYITSRPVPSEVTMEWLDKHGFPAVPVHTTTKDKSKLDFAKEENLDLFVDDSWDVFNLLNNNGVTCYLFDAPHNRRYDVGHLRLKSLTDLK